MGGNSSSLSVLSNRGLSRLGIPSSDATRLDGPFLASSLLLNTLGLLAPIATLHVFDRIIPNAAYETLILMTLGLMVVAVAEFALRRAQARISSLSSACYDRDLRESALTRLIRRPSEDDLKTPPGVQLEQFEAIRRFTSFYGSSARAALVDMLFSVIGLTVIFLMGGWIVLAPLAAIALHYFLLHGLDSAMRERINERRTIDIKSSDFLSEAFRMLLTVKSWALEKLIVRRYERLLTEATQNHCEILVLGGAAERQIRLVSNLATIATLALGGALAIYGSATIGVVAASTLLAGRVVQPALRASKSWSEVRRAALSAEEIRPLFNESESQPLDLRKSGIVVADERPPEAPTVRFNASGEDLPPGAIIAVNSGAVALRRQILEALAGLRPTPENGAGVELRLDGYDPQIYRQKYPGAVAFISSAPQPFCGSVIDNLTVFGRIGSDEAAIEAAERVGFSSDIQKLTHGYETLLAASSAETLPPSGLMKLAITRALVMNARLIVLEEPRTHLSSADAARLRDELKALSESQSATIALATDDADLRSISTHALNIGANAKPTQLQMSPA